MLNARSKKGNTNYQKRLPYIFPTEVIEKFLVLELHILQMHILGSILPALAASFASAALPVLTASAAFGLRHQVQEHRHHYHHHQH